MKTIKNTGEITIHHGQERILNLLKDNGYNLLIAGEKMGSTRYLIHEIIESEEENEG